jgi:hypothetical protein
MIFSTIFAEVRTFASLLTKLSGLAIAGPFFPFFASGRSQDAKGEPEGRCRVATDDVAEVMGADVDPNETD